LFGREKLAQWYQQIDANAFAPLTADLLTSHYDPLYQRAINRATDKDRIISAFVMNGLSEQDLHTAAQTLLAAN